MSKFNIRRVCGIMLGFIIAFSSGAGHAQGIERPKYCAMRNFDAAQSDANAAAAHISDAPSLGAQSATDAPSAAGAIKSTDAPKAANDASLTDAAQTESAAADAPVVPASGSTPTAANSALTPTIVAAPDPAAPSETLTAAPGENQPTDAPSAAATAAVPDGAALTPSLAPSASPTPAPTEAPDEDIGDGSGLKIIDIAPEPDVDWRGGMVFGEGGMRVPQLFQGNYRRVICTYGSIPRSVASSGCNVTCASMVIAYLAGNTVQTPQRLFKWAVMRDLYFGHGLGHAAISQLLAQYGVYGQWVRGDAAVLRAALERGMPIIAHMGPGVFTKKGHYIVLRGLDASGKALVNDPASRDRSARAYDLNLIICQAKTAESFMLCHPLAATRQSPSPADSPIAK